MAMWKVIKYIKETTIVDADTRKEALEESEDYDFDTIVTSVRCTKLKNYMPMHERKRT